MQGLSRLVCSAGHPAGPADSRRNLRRDGIWHPTPPGSWTRLTSDCTRRFRVRGLAVQPRAIGKAGTRAPALSADTPGSTPTPAPAAAPYPETTQDTHIANQANTNRPQPSQQPQPPRTHAGMSHPNVNKASTKTGRPPGGQGQDRTVDLPLFRRMPRSTRVHHSPPEQAG
jgi:hypothetical protein